MRYFLYLIFIGLGPYVLAHTQPFVQDTQSVMSYLEDDEAVSTISEVVDPLTQPSMSLRYSVWLKPTVSILLDGKHQKTIEDASPLVFAYVKDYPLNPFFTAGFTAQLGVLTNTIAKKDYTGLLLEFCFLARPRLPIDLAGEKKTILYSNIEVGLSTLTASHIQIYRGAKIQHLPTSGIAAGCTVGAEYVFDSWMALYLEGGVRYTVINHLLQVPPLKKGNQEIVEKAKKEDKKFFYHDLVCIPISIGFKLYV